MTQCKMGERKPGVDEKQNSRQEATLFIMNIIL